MTLFASRSENNKRNVKVQTTYGPITNVVEEDISHVRSFHTDLGRLLDEMEGEADGTT